jgi:transcriptional regulator with XRE-family HTH domain
MVTNQASVERETPQTEPLGALLRRWRLAAGMSQEALAERTGLSAKGIAQLETGRRTSPRAETLRLLAEALDLNPTQRADLAAASRPGTNLAAPAPPRFPPQSRPCCRRT